MATLVFVTNGSLDGYVDHMKFQPNPALFRLFIDEAEGQAGSIADDRRGGDEPFVGLGDHERVAAQADRVVRDG